MAQVKLLITDFDGTLVDTFKANFLAYQKAFDKYGLGNNNIVIVLVSDLMILWLTWV